MDSRITAIALLLTAATLSPAAAGPFVFNNGDVTNTMASASRPGSTPFEIESADDFVLGTETNISSASFTGLLPTGTALSAIGQVRVEIYRVFPADFNVGRTSGAPLFSTPQVPTRVNSPADVALDDRDTATSSLTFSSTILSRSFTANNSLLPGGINAFPNQTTGGGGPFTGEEVRFDVSFTTPFDLAAGHYFFIPQVALSAGDFLWLSSVRPRVPPATPFAPDLQAWARDQNLDPDWLRIGTDIVGPPVTGAQPPTFNLAFSLAGEAVPEPASLLLLAGAIGVFAGARHRWS